MTGHQTTLVSLVLPSCDASMLNTPMPIPAIVMMAFIVLLFNTCFTL